MDNHTQPKESLIEADVQQSTLESPCYKPRAIILITQVLLVSFTLAACASSASASILQSKKARQEPVVAQDDLNALVSGNNTFAFDLYPAMSNGEDNMIYSPYSLSQVLAMVYAGASGQTAEQMADTLNFTLPQERFHPAFNALDLDLRSRSQPASQAKKAEETPEPDFELNIANAVWAQQGYPYLPEYLDLLAQNYGAGLRLVDFTQAPESAVGKINRWVSEETKGRIKEIVNDLKGCRLVLTNAIYFNGKWGSPFNEEHTKSEPFYLLDGQIERVPLMHQTEYFLYTEGEGYQAIALPYANSNFAMVILLPREGQYREIEKKVTSEWVQDAVRGFESQEVILTMPKYRFETPLINLKELLSSMGMADAFSDYADFSGITQQQPGLKIDYVLHKAFIEVNETKTEAAAASAVLMVEVSRGVRVPTTPPPVVMRIDHPFIFIIRDSQTNTILFVGRVMNPTQ